MCKKYVPLVLLLLPVFLLLFLIMPHQLPAESLPVKAFVIPIEGDIEPSLTVFLRRSIQEAEKAGAEIIVFDINIYILIFPMEIKYTYFISNMVYISF